MDPIEIDEKIKVKTILFAFAIFAILLIGSVAIWYIFNRENETVTIERLSLRCQENAGVVIEGVNETDHGDTNHFALCVPYEALTCIDIE